MSASGPFWLRVTATAREGKLLRAVERVLLGRGDEHDAVAARAAWLDYLRGREFADARVEVLLARLQLETRWAHDRRLERRLAKTLDRSLPPDLVGQAWADLGSLAALRGDAAAAEERFERALDLLWEEGPRARALLGRGWARLARGDARRASADFVAASRLTESLRLVAASLWSAALAFERAGQAVEAERWLRRAGELERVRAKASGRDPFDGVALQPAYEHLALEALRQLFAQGQAELVEDADAAAARHQARCEALASYATSARAASGPTATQAELAWQQACGPAGATTPLSPPSRSAPRPPDSPEPR